MQLTKNINNKLKELRNRILRIIHVWSLFSSKRVYTNLYFLLKVSKSVYIASRKYRFS